ncbi:MAG: DUF3365 domain-containing protein [Gammaproteobacteria bacterium]|nr:DUF3365 domain-containing protein [Gammaproteobacteria bacterium]MDH4254675.1 DUF3365 domain-containing protein [Gammaproteobacteria bacterium]MDH5310027.1 DUF3365 domain-containing protein [Gammaproteobacteria bacterium]
MNRLVALLAFCLVASGLPAAGEESAAAEGARLLAPFKAGLQQALLAGLQEGPVAAIDACRIQAPGIAAGMSSDVLRLGRSSHRLRNPKNRPPDWVAPLLDAYRDDPANRAALDVELPDGRRGYVEPILVQPLCLACHGQALEPAVEAALASAYPEDEARGYEVGDLRGVFWVEYPD